MSDTDFNRSRTTGSAAMGDPTGLSPQHPRASGRSFESHSRDDDYMRQASDMAEEAWRSGQDYYEEGSRRVSRWASEHPNQLWAVIAAVGAFALWMAYRPMSGGNDRGFDPSRYRYRRPAGSSPARMSSSGASSASGSRRPSDVAY